VLNLRGTLRVECGQTVLECLVSDKKVLEALGAAQMLVDTEGTAPSALVTAISQGCGAHIRKHAYRYTKRISTELVRIQRIKQMKNQILALIGTLAIAVSVSFGNYISRLAYEAAPPSGMMLWIVPLAVIFGLIALVLVGISIYLCCKGTFVKTACLCAAAFSTCLRGCFRSGCSACRARRPSMKVHPASASH